MFSHTIIPYSRVVSAARETAERICAQGDRRMHVHVTTLGGTTASVMWDENLAKLNLPTIPSSQVMTRAEANRIVGLIAHECCHVMHTSWRDWTIAAADGKAIRELTNGIEDVRIEAREIARRNLAGLRDALSDTCTMMHGRSLEAAMKNGTVIGSRPEHASYVIAMLGRLANGYAIPNASGLAAGIAPQYRSAIDYALAHMPALQSTAGAHALARIVLDMLKQAKASEPKRPPQQPQASDDSDDGDDQDGQDGNDAGDSDGQDGDASDAGDSDGQDGDASDAGDNDGQDGDSDGQDGDSDGQDGQDGDSDGLDAGASGNNPDSDSDDANGAGDGTQSQQDLDNEDWLNASPDVDDIAKAKDAQDPEDYRNHAHRRAMLNNFGRANMMRTRNVSGNETRIRDRVARPAVLTDSVSRLVLSEARNANEHYLSAGRFDRRAIARASWGASNVFARRTYAEGIETAVFLLIDCSDSMRSLDRILDAQSLAYHLGEAIDAAGARCAIGGFYAFDAMNEPGFRITLRMAKDWNEHVDLARIAGLGLNGTTPLSPAIIAASEMLAEVRDVDRRILLALTDGQCDLGRNCVRDACAIGDLLGVEIAGIGIGGSTDCATTFPVGVDLGSGADLTEAGLRLLVDKLEKGRG